MEYASRSCSELGSILEPKTTTTIPLKGQDPRDWLFGASQSTNTARRQGYAHLEVLLGVECRDGGALQEVGQAGLQLVAVGEQGLAAEDVEPQPGPAHGHHQPADVPDVPHRPRPDQGQQDDVVLLPLVLVHRCHLHERCPGLLLLFKVESTN